MDLFSQKCYDDKAFNCNIPLDWDYELNSQSTQFKALEGQAVRVNVVLYAGTKYSIFFCLSDDITGISYRLIDNNLEIAKGTINKGYEYEFKKLDFINSITRNVTIEIKIFRTSNKIDYEIEKCVGVIIGHNNDYKLIND